MEGNEQKRTCGAKTRQGTPCKRTPTLLGRCNLHGGKSLAGIAHPNYKHGYYYKHSLVRPIIQIAQLKERIRKKAARRVAKELAIEAEKKRRNAKPPIPWNDEVLLLLQLSADQAIEHVEGGVGSKA